MAFTFDESTYKISLPQGDTADIDVSIDYAGIEPGDALLFAIFDPQSGDLMSKTVELQDGRAHIRLCNHDTRDIAPGTYKWNLRIITNPARDADGHIIADDCTDDVITVFGEKLPIIKIYRGGAHV